MVLVFAAGWFSVVPPKGALIILRAQTVVVRNGSVTSYLSVFYVSIDLLARKAGFSKICQPKIESKLDQEGERRVSTTGTDNSNQEQSVLPIRAYIRRRDSLGDRGKRMSRRARRRLLDISQTYWAVEQDDNFTDEERKHRWELLRKYGDFTMAYSTFVQPLLKYHEQNSLEGFIGYRQRWGMTFALGDPVAANEDKLALIKSFCDQNRGVTFCQISESTAEILHGLGFYVNEMGVDTVLDLATYDFAGKEKEWLRYAENWSKRRGYEVKECGFGEVTADEIEAVSEAWRKTRTVKRKEVRFLNRPIVVANPEPEVRKFYFLDADKKLLAFVFLDPIYRNGKIVGYVTAFKRRHPDAPQYAEQAIMKVIIEKLKAEGVEVLRLGLSPAAWVEDHRFKANWFTSKLFKAAFHSKSMNHYCYNLIGHANYKRRFRGREEKTYFASASRYNSLRLLALIGLCGAA